MSRAYIRREKPPLRAKFRVFPCFLPVSWNRESWRKWLGPIYCGCTRYLHKIWGLRLGPNLAFRRAVTEVLDTVRRYYICRPRALIPVVSPLGLQGRDALLSIYLLRKFRSSLFSPKAGYVNLFRHRRGHSLRYLDRLQPLAVLVMRLALGAR